MTEQVGRAAAVLAYAVAWPLIRLFGRDSARSRRLEDLREVAAGRKAWVGPEWRQPGELDFRREEYRLAASVRAGLVSLWWVRQRTSIAFGRQVETDCEYAATRSLRGDLGILFRAALAQLYGASPASYVEQPVILGVPLDNCTMDSAIDRILAPAESARARQVSFINADCLNKAVEDGAYREVLATSDLRLGDGIGLRMGGRMLGREIRQNVNGTDLFPRLCERMEAGGLRLFLLGGRPGVAEGVSAWIRARHQALRVVGCRHGYFRAEEDAGLVEQIRESKADVLLVAFGAPRQEAWIRKHRDRLGVRSALGVGGLLDFYSGRIPRAPQWLRELGLEWAYRLYQEPGRMWRRYLVGNIVFLCRVARERRRERLKLKAAGSWKEARQA
jgi:N-acetylglucosaminyldiphosphoundecaprenol N-acetyl-beta-D-mannosaminyltransferase